MLPLVSCQHQHAGAGVYGAVGGEAAAADDDVVERADKGHGRAAEVRSRADKGHCALVADELASIDEHVSSAGHVASGDHRGLHP